MPRLPERLHPYPACCFYHNHRLYVLIYHGAFWFFQFISKKARTSLRRTLKTLTLLFFLQRSVLIVLKANPSTFLVCADFLLATVLDEVLNGRFRAGKDILDCLLSGDILNLSAAKLKLIGQISCIGVRNIGHHRFPNLAFDFEGWLVNAPGTYVKFFPIAVQR